MKVSIFRVEKPCGTGPYMDEEGHPLLKHMNAVHGDADHPDPFDDELLDGIYPDESCCFATLDAVEDWFAGYEDALDECGYGIVVYSVPLRSVRYGRSRGQAVFVRADAVQVRTIPMR